MSKFGERCIFRQFYLFLLKISASNRYARAPPGHAPDLKPPYLSDFKSVQVLHEERLVDAVRLPAVESSQVGEESSDGWRVGKEVAPLERGYGIMTFLFLSLPSKFRRTVTIGNSMSF